MTAFSRNAARNSEKREGFVKAALKFNLESANYINWQANNLLSADS